MFCKAGSGGRRLFELSSRTDRQACHTALSRKCFPLLLPPGARCNNWWGIHSAVGGLEARDPLLGAGELLRGHNGLQDLEDVVPEGVVLLAEQDEDTGRLRVEGRGHVQDDLLCDLDDLLVRDRHVLVEGVDGAARLDRLEECLGRHCWWW